MFQGTELSKSKVENTTVGAENSNSVQKLLALMFSAFENVLLIRYKAVRRFAIYSKIPSVDTPQSFDPAFVIKSRLTQVG